MVFRRSKSRFLRPRFSRFALILLISLGGAGGLVWAQDDGGGDAPAGGGTGTAPSNPGGGGTDPGTSSPPTTITPGTGGSTITPPSDGSGPTDIFAPAPVSGTFGPSPDAPSTTNGTLPDATTPVATAPAEPAVTVNGAYGSSPIVLQPGVGRFAQKPLKFSISTSVGYDDNVFSASDKAAPTTQIIPGTPDQKITVIRVPAQPAQPLRILPGGIVIPGRPAIPAQTEEVTIAGTPDQTIQGPDAQGPLGSFTTGGNVQATLNIARPRTLFSLQLNVGTQYFWSRPGKKSDYNGSVNLVLSHRVTPRLRTNMSLSSVYQNTPDFSRSNIATRNAQGPYYDTNFRLDLEYQWALRFSTITSYSFNGTYFEQAAQKTQNVTQNILGNDFRFTLSPRTTLVASYRASEDSHEIAATDTTGQFLLGGFDFSLSSRLATTVRAGLQVQSYRQGTGATTTSPYIEATMSYQYLRGSTINWTNRYGLEAGDLSTRSVTSYITGLNINHVLSARTSLGVGVNLTHRGTEYVNSAQSSLAENYISANVGLQYIFTANWSFNVRYDYFKLISNSAFADYSRNRFSISAEYDF